MTPIAQAFAADHVGALKRSSSLDAGREPQHPLPAVDLPGLGPVDLELLGDAVAAAVEFGTGETELAEVDLEHENLYRLPSFLAEALAELTRAEDPELPDDVARAWVEEAELTLGPDEVLEVVTSLAQLAAQAEEAGLDLYLWTETG